MTQVSDGQSLLDICLQELGDLSAAYDLADANGLAITDVLTPGQQLIIPSSLLGRSDVAAYFTARAQRINTGKGTELETTTEQPTSQAKYFNNSYFKNTYFA
ncbi:LysM peptidoglycan-binding domain-containing protein [Hymenobacter cavernae]|uniref:LysM domain-containing protein n=1 Tax=Hymenobacter cavernae TaxID=2044852 RepID=A0ABQ1UMA2_9BACT|nr:LysM domain-containing protein [Hymenobacter cavernae]GGF22190.1 hypothetical protein GCM10011383_37270 [Hymenobacter cavernae]